MQHFTIRDIENLTGIKAHTLRIWEKRYSLFQPTRKESLHRIYDNEDLQVMLRVAFLYHNDWKISKIATLSDEELKERIHTVDQPSTYEGHVLQLVEASISFNEPLFRHILEGLIQKMGFHKCITDVCYPFLQRIGLLWMTNHVIPAQEHFASYLIQNRIISETGTLPPAPPGEPPVLLFAPQGEFHELPLLFINYELKRNGWNTLYLGSNISGAVLKPFTEQTNARYLFLHIITNFTGYELDDYYEQICRTFPDRKIIATGAGSRNHQRNFVNLTVLRSDEEIYAFIERKKII